MSGGLRGHDLGIDVFELRVSIRMLRAFLCFAVELAREAELYQLFLDGIGADRMASGRQRICQLVHALRHPDQGPHGVAERRGFDEALEFSDQSWIVCGDTLAATAGASRLAFRQRLIVELVRAAIDCRAGQTGHFRDDLQAAPPRRLDLGRREQPPPSLVERTFDPVPTSLYRCMIDHADELRLFARRRNPDGLSHTVTRTRIAIRLLFGVS